MRNYLPVTFLRIFGGYNVGDTATFEEDRSNALVKAGVAEHYVDPSPVVEQLDPPTTNKRSKRVKEQETCQAAPAENLF
jgi:hypothetical protein